MVVSAREQQGAAAGRWGDILWLAKRDIRRDWLAYLGSALYMVGIGALGAPRDEMPLGTWAPEVLFVVLMILLAQPFLSREYFSWENDKVAERLLFLRLFPIPVDVIVGGRMVAMLAALVLNVPALFIPIWLLMEWEHSGIDYIWFLLFWTGIAIGLSGYSLCMEMGASIKRYVLTNVVILTVLFVLMTAVGVLFDAWMVRGSVGLIERFGPLVPLVGLAGGIATFVLSGRLASSRLRARSLVP